MPLSVRHRIASCTAKPSFAPEEGLKGCSAQSGQGRWISPPIRHQLTCLRCSEKPARATCDTTGCQACGREAGTALTLLGPAYCARKSSSGCSTNSMRWRLSSGGPGGGGPCGGAPRGGPPGCPGAGMPAWPVQKQWLAKQRTMGATQHATAPAWAQEGKARLQVMAKCQAHTVSAVADRRTMTGQHRQSDMDSSNGSRWESQGQALLNRAPRSEETAHGDVRQCSVTSGLLNRGGCPSNQCVVHSPGSLIPIIGGGGMGGRCIGGGMMGGRGCGSCCRPCNVQNDSQGRDAKGAHAKRTLTLHRPCTVRPDSCPRHLPPGQAAMCRATSGHHGLGRPPTTTVMCHCSQPCTCNPGACLQKARSGSRLWHKQRCMHVLESQLTSAGLGGGGS